MEATMGSNASFLLGISQYVLWPFPYKEGDELSFEITDKLKCSLRDFFCLKDPCSIGMKFQYEIDGFHSTKKASYLSIEGIIY